MQQAKKDAPDVLDQFSSAVGQLSTIVSTVSKLTTLLGMGDLVAQLAKMFIPGKPDPIAQALTAIQQKLDVVLHFEVASAEKEHMFQVNDLVANAETNWRTLFETQFDFNNPLVNIALTEENTSNAANELAQKDMYWLRPFYDGLIFNDGVYEGPSPPLDFSLGPGLPQVFDYRLTLPAFLYSVQIRCGFVLSLHKAQPMTETDAIVEAFKRTEVQPMLNRLQSTYETMVAGIVPVRCAKDLGELVAWQKAASARGDGLSAWETAGGSRVGVVDIYAGLGNIEQFFDQGFIRSDLAFAVYQARFNLNNMLRWKNWYARGGFGSVWSSIQSVRGLLGEVPDAFDTNALWSIKDIASALGPSLLKITPGVPLALSSVLKALALVGSPGVPVPPIVPPVSFRSLLNNGITQQDFVG
jgi:hypothetical protein